MNLAALVQKTAIRSNEHQFGRRQRLGDGHEGLNHQIAALVSVKTTNEKNRLLVRALERPPLVNWNGKYRIGNHGRIR